MDDHQLVRDCLKEKPEAQRQLYRQFAETMLGVCYRYTKSITDAEDVLQEGFVKVFRNLHQYRFQGELGAWIRRIMVNSALNFLRSNRKYQDQLFFTEEYLHPVSDDNPAMLLEARELADLIRRLPSGCQLVFNLYAVEGYSHGEISEMLGILDSSSRSQYVRARRMLLSWIEGTSLQPKKIKYVEK